MKGDTNEIWKEDELEELGVEVALQDSKWIVSSKPRGLRRVRKLREWAVSRIRVVKMQWFQKNTGDYGCWGYGGYFESFDDPGYPELRKEV